MHRIIDIALQPLRSLSGRLSDPKGALRPKSVVAFASVLTLALLLARCEILSPSSDTCDEATSPRDGPVGAWEFVGLRGEDIVSVAVDPCDPNTILAGSLFDFSGGRRGKLLRSEDRGKTWDTVRVGGNYLQVLFDHNSPDNAYASVFPTLDAPNSGSLRARTEGVAGPS